MAPFLDQRCILSLAAVYGFVFTMTCRTRISQWYEPTICPTRSGATDFVDYSIGTA